MKDFVVEKREEYLDLSENVASPFKFVEVKEQDDGSVLVQASIWKRIDLVSYLEAMMAEDVEERMKSFFKDRSTS